MITFPTVKNTKKPAIKQWQTLTASVKSNPDNRGLLCGKASGITVVDVDKPDGFGFSVETKRVNTSKGYHLYFKYDPDFKNWTNLNGAVDIRTDKGYVMAEGALHPSGCRYELANDHPVAEMPAKLKEWLMNAAPVTDKKSPKVSPKASASEQPAVLNDYKVPKGQVFDCVKNNLILFKRTEPSHCSICSRTHHKDNTYYWSTSGDAMYEGCIRSKKTKKIFPKKKAKVELADLIKAPVIERETNALFKTVHSRYISDVKKIQKDKHGLMAIQSAQGTGKSEFIRRMVEGTTLKFMDISHRISLTKEKVNNRYTNVFNYQDLKPKERITNEITQVVCQMNSIWKCEWTNEDREDGYICDLLILDEVLALRRQIGSANIQYPMRVMAKLKQLVKYAKKVIVMDSDVTIEVMEWLQKLRGCSDYVVYQNTYNEHFKDRTVQVTKDKNEAVCCLEKLLKEGKKCYVATNQSKEKQLALQKRLSEYKTIVINQETHYLREVQLCLENVNDPDHGFGAYDCVICSPTVQSGVSYDNNDFDYVFGLFNNCTNTYMDCMQMLNRVRRFSSNLYCISLQQIYGTKITDKNELIEFNNRQKAEVINFPLNFELDANGAKVYQLNDLYNTYLDIQVEKNHSHNEFMASFINTAKLCGMTVELLKKESKRDKTEVKRDLKKIEDEIKEEDYKGICKQIPEVIGNPDYVEEIRREMQTRAVSRDEMLTLKAHMLTKYDVNFSKLSMDGELLSWVKSYGNRTVRHQYNNLNKIYGGIDKIKAEEKEKLGKSEIKDLVRSQFAKFKYIDELVKDMGFSSVFDKNEIKLNTKEIQKKLKKYDAKYLYKIYEKDPRKSSSWNKWDNYERGVCRVVSDILKGMYGHKISLANKRKRLFKIERNPLFNYADGDSPDDDAIKPKLKTVLKKAKLKDE